MKTKIEPQDIFSASFRLQSADISEETKTALSKILLHSSKTNYILFFIIIGSFLLTQSFGREEIPSFQLVLIGASPVVAFLYYRYINLHKRILEIMKTLKN